MQVEKDAIYLAKSRSVSNTIHLFCIFQIYNELFGISNPSKKEESFKGWVITLQNVVWKMNKVGTGTTLKLGKTIGSTKIGILCL